MVNRCQICIRYREIEPAPCPAFRRMIKLKLHELQRVDSRSKQPPRGKAALRAQPPNRQGVKRPIQGLGRQQPVLGLCPEGAGVRWDRCRQRMTNQAVTFSDL